MAAKSWLSHMKFPFMIAGKWFVDKKSKKVPAGFVRAASLICSLHSEANIKFVQSRGTVDSKVTVLSAPPSSRLIFPKGVTC